MGSLKKRSRKGSAVFDFLIKSITSIVKGFVGKVEEAAPAPPAIRIEPRIEEMFSRGLRLRPGSIREIVVHGTAGGSSMDSLVNWMLGGEQAENYSRGIGLFHFAIGRDGEIVQIINPKWWVYHSLSGAHDQETVGIELINPTRDNSGAYTDEQYKALTDLCDYLMRTHVYCRQIVSHNHNGMIYSRIGKNCPGNFDWQRLSQSLVEKKWNIRTINREVLYVA